MYLSTIRRYIRRRFRKTGVLRCFNSSFGIAINILNSALFSRIVVEAAKGNVKSVVTSAAAILSVKLIEFVFNLSAGIALGKTESLGTHDCKMFFYRLFFDKPLKDLCSLGAGETKEKINDDFNTVTRKYASVYPGFVTVTASVVAYTVYLLILDRRIAFVLLLISLIQMIPPVVIKKYLQVNYERCRRIEARITDFTVEGYRGFMTIKLYGLKKWWRDRLAEYHKEYSKIGRASIYTGTAEGVLFEITDKVLTYGTYGTVGLFVLNGLSSLDIGIRAIALSGSLFGAVKGSFSIIKDLAVSRTAEKRLLDELPDTVSPDGRIGKGSIVISGLTYGHGGRTLFSDLDLSIDSTKLTVIKGPNGGGKTTLLRLIAGALGHETGEIKLDGVDPTSLSGDNYPGKLFYLPQDDAVFDFTADELFYMILGDKKDRAEGIVRRFAPDDDQILLSKISELSGGERKKVFLSLAFASDPVIMMLDEPTNSLDEAGKETLRKLLTEREGGAIVITHDGFLDGLCDSVYVIESGSVRRGEGGTE